MPKARKQNAYKNIRAQYEYEEAEEADESLPAAVVLLRESLVALEAVEKQHSDLPEDVLAMLSELTANISDGIGEVHNEIIEFLANAGIELDEMDEDSDETPASSTEEARFLEKMEWDDEEEEEEEKPWTWDLNDDEPESDEELVQE